MKAQPEIAKKSDRKHGRTVLTVLSAAIVCALTASAAFAQQPLDFVYLLNRSNSTVAVAKIDVYGHYTPTSTLTPDPYVPAGVTHVVSSANGILLYNADTGYAVLEQIKPDGTRFVGNAANYSTGWETILSIGEFFFFYKSDGSAAISYVTPNGQLVSTKGYAPGWFSYWSMILVTDNYLFFYNANNGAMALGWITPQGTFQQTWSAPSSSFSSTFSYGVSDGRFILMYNQQTGAAFVGGVETGGTGIYAITSLALPVGYNKLVRHDNYLLLYNSNDGSGLIGYVDVFSPDRFVVTQSPAFSPYWTRIVSTRTDLFFYNSVTGLAVVGRIDAGGHFQQNAPFSVVAGSSGVVATTR